jgi:molybdopterin molybdotransferase
MPANGNREAYLRAKKSPGVQAIVPIVDEDSSLMSVLANSNALIRREVGALPASEGDPVQYMRWTA